MRSKPLRASQAQEKRLARELGGQVTPRSGAGWRVKGDVRTDDELVEAKWTGKTQVTIKAEVLQKISDEAAAELRRPVTAFDVGGQRYVVMPEFYYAELRDAAITVVQVCNVCDEPKPLTEEFWHRRNDVQGFHRTCKPCAAARAKAWQQANRERFNAGKRLRKDARLEYVNEIKRVPCMDCGESYPPYVMDFDHRENKVMNVSLMVQRGVAWEALYAEIEKCDVVCSNCHRLRTFGRVPYSELRDTAAQAATERDQPATSGHTGQNGESA